MGLASISVDSVPSRSFTPQESLVELLRVCISKNCLPFLAEPSDKTFLITWLVKEWSWKVRHNRDSRILFVVPTEEKVSLWDTFLSRLTNLQTLAASSSEVAKDVDTQQHEVVIATAESAKSLTNCKKVCLLIVDNGHSEQQIEALKELQNGALVTDETRIVSFLGNVLRAGKSEIFEPLALETLTSHLKASYPGVPEAACDILSMLRFFCRPSTHILEYAAYNEAEVSSIINAELDAIVEHCYSLFNNHCYSLLEVYGEEFQDLIADVPDPCTLPKKLLDDFQTIRNSLGLWSAERAALLLIIKLEKLKTREKYERHFLLFSVLYSEMVKIKKIFENALGDMDDVEKLLKYSSPKMIRLVEVLRQYKPEHVCRVPSKKVEPTRDPKSEDKPQQSQSSTTTTSIHTNKPASQSRGKSKYSSYDDPNALCGVIFVQDKFVAKLLYHFLKDLSRSDDSYSFLMPQYALGFDQVDLVEGEVFEQDLERRKQEDSLRKFRMKESNLLISNSMLEVGVDAVRCNLVVAMDPPKDFNAYAHFKVKAKAQNSHFIIFGEDGRVGDIKGILNMFQRVENHLKANCTFPGIEGTWPPASGNKDSTSENESRPNVRNQRAMASAYYCLNRYCAKLPSDTL